MQNTFRLTLPALIMLLCGMLVFVVFSVIAPALSVPPQAAKLIFSAIVIVSLFALSHFFVSLDKVSFAEVNLIPDEHTIWKLMGGLLIGTVITSVMLISLFSMTELSLERHDSQSFIAFFWAALVFIPLAFMEELLFRGYPFFRLAQLINIRWVIFITAVLFGLYHYNESVTVFTVLMGPGVWGVIYGVAAYASNSLVMPLGIHIAVNVIQAMIGMKNYVSPMWEMTSPDTQLSDSINPDSLGLIMQIVLLVISWLVLELVIKTKQH